MMIVWGFDDPFHQVSAFLGVTVLFILVLLMPVRILQKRHGYPSYILLLAFIPYIGPLAVVWGFAVATPKTQEMETA
ncbi:hypothetical protein FZX02_00735 [Synechococcus sp. MU1644]|nr:hypothetical protein [Synechococcus sp. MU1644]